VSIASARRQGAVECVASACDSEEARAEAEKEVGERGRGGRGAPGGPTAGCSSFDMGEREVGEVKREMGDGKGEG
jgi:hypothetical protein